MGRITTDPCEAATEGVTMNDPIHPENIPTSDGASSAHSQVTPPAVVGESRATSSPAIAVPVVEIPLPELPTVSNLGTDSGVTQPDSSSKEKPKTPPSESTNPSAVQPPPTVEAEKPQTPRKPKAKSVSMRKAPTPKETPEQMAEREKAERLANEQADQLIRQEQVTSHASAKAAKA